MDINGAPLSGSTAKENDRGLAPGGYGFEKGDRLLKRSRFIQLSRKGDKFHGPLFWAAVMEGETRRIRIGITVTKKIGSAVTRNRIKRQVREFFRNNKQKFPQGIDINVIAKTGAATAGSEKIYESLAALFEKIKGGEKSKHWHSY